MEIKKCRDCGQEFEATLEFFYKNKYSTDGLDYQCKQCRNAERTRYAEATRNNLKKIDGVTYKYCPVCKEWKERTLGFQKLTGGFRKDCIDCRIKSKKDMKSKRVVEKRKSKEIDSKRERLEIAAYNRFIKQPQDCGVGGKELDIDLVEGRQYLITKTDLRDNSTKYKKIVKGVLIQVTKDLITIKTNNYCESFKKVDVLIGECELREA